MVEVTLGFKQAYIFLYKKGKNIEKNNKLVYINKVLKELRLRFKSIQNSHFLVSKFCRHCPDFMTYDSLTSGCFRRRILP